MIPRHTSRPVAIRRLVPAAALAMLVGLGVGCSSDSDESAQEEYCQAGEDLQTDMTSLESVDVVAEGTNGVESAISTINDDLSNLADSANDASEDEVQALQNSVDDVQSTLDDLGGELTADNASAVLGAIQGTIDSASAVYDTLSDC